MNLRSYSYRDEDGDLVKTYTYKGCSVILRKIRPYNTWACQAIDGDWGPSLIDVKRVREAEQRVKEFIDDKATA